MARKLFKTKFTNGLSCTWMKRNHPDHPCHKPHVGEIYCLYDKKKQGWGYAIFNVLQLPGLFIVRSMYHINREISAYTKLKNPLLEFGYIIRNGGRIKYNEEDVLSLDNWQSSFRYDTMLQCEVTLHRQYIETIDIHPDPSLLRRFEPRHKEFLAPYLSAIEKEEFFEELDYHPYLTQAGRLILEEIREVYRRGRGLTVEMTNSLLNRVLELIGLTLDQMETLVYPRLFEQQKELFNKFEKDPLSCFDARPNLMELKNWTGISGADLKALFKERHDLSVSQFIKKAWMKEVCRRLLADPQESLESIAFELGWGSAGSLSTDFKLIIGKVPSEYRRLGH